MGPVRQSWQDACNLALAESDPAKVIGRVSQAIEALERRYVDWARTPGSAAELIAIRKAIFALERLAAAAARAATTEGASDPDLESDLSHVRTLFLVLRS